METNRPSWIEPGGCERSGSVVWHRFTQSSAPSPPSGVVSFGVRPISALRAGYACS